MSVAVMVVVINGGDIGSGDCSSGVVGMVLARIALMVVIVVVIMVAVVWWKWCCKDGFGGDYSGGGDDGTSGVVGMVL